MQWDPFLMEVLLKKEVCGSREQCTKPTGKLKKDALNTDAGRLINIQKDTKSLLFLYN